MSLLSFFSAVAALILFNPVLASPTAHKRALATVYEHCVKPKTVALTFDDGPYIYHQKISDEITNAGGKATFFFNGNNYDCIYSSDSIARVKYAYNAGHQVSSHTWSHGDLTTFNSDQINDAMYRMEEAFERIIGVKPAFMRPPYGNYNDNVRTVAAARGQALALWDWDTGDADGNNTQQAEAVYQDAVNAKVSNMVVLNHETQQMTADSIIPYAINLLKKNGYQLVTLADCLGVEPYQSVGSPQQPTSQWTCNGTPAPGQACSGSQCETGTPSGGGGGGGGTPPPTRSNQWIHPNGNTGKCLAAASNANGAAVEIEDCANGSAAQSWTFTGFNIQIYGDKCLDVTNGNAANGNKMQIYTCNAGNSNQQWAVSGTTIQWQGHSSCLDNTGGSTTDGNVVQIWSCTSGANQKWQIVNAGGSTPPPSGGKTIRPGKSSSTCLTATSNANNAAVVVKPCDGSDGQSWTETGGTFTIFSNKCLDVTSGSTTNGVKMQIYTCSAGNTNQQFVDTSDNRIAWTNHGECLDLTNGSTAANNPIQMWQCTNGNTNQVWNLQ